MTYTAKTAKELREEKGSLLEKIASELALIQAEVLTAEISDVGTTSTTFTVDSDSVLGKIAITAVAGAANKTLTLSNSALTDNRTISFPDATATVATLTGTETLTSKTINQNAAALPAGVTGTPVLKYGDIDTAVSYLLTASFVPWQVKVSAGGAVTGTLGASYFSTATGIALAATGQLATCMVRTTVSHNLKDAYGLQSHLTIGASMGTTSANAHLTAISGKITLSATPTVATGWGTAGLFILEGAGSFTQMCSAVSLVQEAGCSAAKEMLYINNDGTATVGINFVGNFTKGITFNNATVSQGLDNFILSLGTINSTISYTPSDSYVPIQVNLTSIADHGTSGNETIGATYLRTATSTANQPNHQLATCMVRVKVANNIWDAYGVQSHLSFGNVTVSTTGANAHLTAISGKVTFDTTTVTKGWVTAGLFIIEGAGTCSQMCHGVSIVEEAGSTGAQSLLHLNTDVGTTPYLSFSGADGTGKSIYTHTAAGTQLGTIMILVNGVQKWIPFMQAE
jgi:hypothetical protein